MSGSIISPNSGELRKEWNAIKALKKFAILKQNKI